ncbi:MAG: hypothetical protein JNJ83_15470 [Verrucomicrobiaceae bacterium]|nr:hypothetical protein [Verrucomicrobiaceae bacterium]
MKSAKALLLTSLLTLPGHTQEKKADKPAAAEVVEAVKTEVRRAEIPEELLGDEHLREEFGVNGITTPSIEAIFELLDTLGTLSYDRLNRPIPAKAPTDRVAVSLSLGTLIADGFLVVQCEKLESMDEIGRSLLKHAKILGAGARMNRHSQSLLEQSISGDWKKLRVELSKTQFDVEAEMVQLRDVDIAHLVSLGGWLRAFHIATQAVHENYHPDKTRNLARRDITEYFLQSLEGLSEKVQQIEVVKQIREGLQDLMPMVDVPEGKELTKEEVEALFKKARSFTKMVEATIGA